MIGPVRPSIPEYLIVLWDRISSGLSVCGIAAERAFRAIHSSKLEGFSRALKPFALRRNMNPAMLPQRSTGENTEYKPGKLYHRSSLIRGFRRNRR
ncbi:MAG: hypothetical protein JWP63_3618 [Candidatus Solibacter sp.]|nr:hypothetical protein [Candidatus Solibacter sp.]